MGDHTKTRNKSEISNGRLGIHRQLGAKPTASPTMSRCGRQLIFDFGRITMFKADAKTDFLQGSVQDQELDGELVAELSQAWSLEHHQCVHLRKAVYKLTDAPRAWWERAEKDTTNRGWRSLTTELSFCVKTSSEGWSTVWPLRGWNEKALRMGPWVHGTSTQCGVEIVQSRHQGRWEVSHCRAQSIGTPGIAISSKKTTCRVNNHRGTVSASWFVGTVDAAYNSGDSSVASTLLVASGLCWSYHSFPQCFRPTNLLAVRWVGLRHRCELVSAAVFVLLAGLV